MTNDINLLSYLPAFMGEYYEIQKIMGAETPEFQMLWDMNENTRRQLFIVTATEQGLSRFEKLLGIFPTSEDTLESRKARILTLWNDVTPYTFRALIQMLRAICGDDFEVIPNFNEYSLEIITHIGFFGGVRDLAYIIDNIIPMNLVVISTNSLEVISAGNARVSSALIPTVIYMVTNDFEAAYTMTGATTAKSTLVQTSIKFVTNDFEAEYSANGQASNGSTLVQVNVHRVTNDFEAEYSANGQANSGSTLVQVNVHFTTNDFESTYSMNGQINNGSNAAVVSEFLITNDFEATVSVNGSATNKTAALIVTEYQI